MRNIVILTYDHFYFDTIRCIYNLKKFKNKHTLLFSNLYLNMWDNM